MPTFEQLRSSYGEQLKRCQVRPAWQGSIERAAQRIVRNRARYKEVARSLGGGIPWAFIAVLHDRESGGNFGGVLHNGEHIIGSGRQTRLVPAGRGPFDSWEEAALDALRLKQLDVTREWDMERVCYEGERFNGFGYRNRGVPSAYLWSGTNIYSSGKYVADGVWSSTAVDKQLGIIPLYLRVLDLAGETRLRGTSRKLNLIGRARAFIKAAIASAGGIFTLDTFGLLKEWFSMSEGLLAPSSLAILLVLGLGGWWLLNTLDKLVVQDHAEGRYTPSGDSKMEDADVDGVA